MNDAFDKLDQSVKYSIIRVRNVLIVTISPDSEDTTLSLLQQKVLEKMSLTQSKGVILDISLVDIIDSYFARAFLEFSGMVELMGGRIIIAGMHPSVAITVVELGLNLGDIHTALNVDHALDLLDAMDE